MDCRYDRTPNFDRTTNYHQREQSNHWQASNKGSGYNLRITHSLDMENNQNTTKFLYLNPVLPSLDVAKDIAFWEQKLGFKNVYDSTHYSDGPADYAVLGRQGLFIHLQMQFPKDMANGNLTQIKFQVENIQPLFEEYLANGVITKDRFRKNTPWGTNEFGFYDANKNAIFFYEDCK